MPKQLERQFFPPCHRSTEHLILIILSCLSIYSPILCGCSIIIIILIFSTTPFYWYHYYDILVYHFACTLRDSAPETNSILFYCILGL